MNNDNYVIVMAGGVGSRFWPFSRTKHPKQFQDILGKGCSMLQETVSRFEGICPPENIYIVSHEQYRTLIAAQLPNLDEAQVLLEPIRRNTAPCIAYAAYKIASQNPDANLVVTPADHVIGDVKKFRKTIRQALENTAEEDVLLTLGIKPTRPDTGYGYIQQSKQELKKMYKVKLFAEKPSAKVAQTFLNSGEFLWNAGIFVWNARTLILAFRKYLYEIHKAFFELNALYYTPKEAEAVKIAYYQCRNVSIDYGIMEKADNVYVMPGTFSWSDLGTWQSLHEITEKDDNQNALQGNIMSYDTKNCIIKTPQKKLVVVEGLADYIVAEHEDVLLICKKENEQQIRNFVKKAKEKFDGKYT